MVQTSFNLVVNSDGVEPTPPTTPPTPPVEETKESDGGSLGWLAILMLGLMAASRQKWNVNK
ncbi:GlyGly-CTERM sorting domain-containing protein [Shewanella xiamenensis]|nr:GlyGly-CTERM sorting domain-containing protein [Shewanella xiamenensis]